MKIIFIYWMFLFLGLISRLSWSEAKLLSRSVKVLLLFVGAVEVLLNWFDPDNGWVGVLILVGCNKSPNESNSIINKQTKCLKHKLIL